MGCETSVIIVPSSATTSAIVWHVEQGTAGNPSSAQAVASTSAKPRPSQEMAPTINGRPRYAGSRMVTLIPRSEYTPSGGNKIRTAYVSHILQ